MKRFRKSALLLSIAAILAALLAVIFFSVNYITKHYGPDQLYNPFMAMIFFGFMPFILPLSIFAYKRDKAGKKIRFYPGYILNDTQLAYGDTIIDDENLPSIILTLDNIRQKAKYSTLANTFATLSFFFIFEFFIFSFQSLEPPFMMPSFGWTIVISVVILLLACLYLYRLYLPIIMAIEKVDPERYVPESELPKLYRIAEQAAQKAGCTKKVYISLNADTTVRLENFKEHVVVWITPQAMCVLREEEFFALLVYRFLLLDSPAQQAVSRNRFWVRVFRNTEEMRAFFWDTRNRMTRFVNTFNTVFIYSIKQVSEKTDREMLQLGLAKDWASAIAKFQMMIFFNRDPEITVTDPFLRPESPRNNTCSLLCDGLRRAISDYKDIWLGFLQKEIPLSAYNAKNTWPSFRGATAPVKSLGYDCFPARMEALENPTFDLSLPDENLNYYAEIRKCIDHVDAYKCNMMSISYENERYENYILPMMTIEEFESKGGLDNTDKQKLGFEYLIMVLMAYNNMINIQAEEKICDYLIDNFSAKEINFAYVRKGEILLSRYDDKGAEFLEQAAINANYIEPYVNNVGQYFRLTGNEEKLLAFCKQLPEMQKKYADKKELTTLMTSDVFTKSKLEKTQLDEIKNYILSIAGDNVEHIYAAEKKQGDARLTIIMPKYKENTDARTLYETNAMLFAHLDGKEGEFMLMSENEIPPALAKRLPELVLF